MKVRVVIADDEPVARAGLREMLVAVSWVDCVGEAAHGHAAVRAVNELRPDLLLLDIQMPGLLGTDVLRAIEHKPFVIFTTAYAEHAVTAFELAALDYILKPFGPARLSTALERVQAAIGEPAARQGLERFGDAMSPAPISRLFIRTGDTIVPVAVRDVRSFEADGDYVIASTTRARHPLHVSLSRLETRLDPERFVRIHRTSIVNLDHVRAFRRDGGGRLFAEFADGTTLPVSRARAHALRRLGV